jgi:hypothetical protein
VEEDSYLVPPFWMAAILYIISRLSSARALRCERFTGSAAERAGCYEARETSDTNRSQRE